VKDQDLLEAMNDLHIHAVSPKFANLFYMENKRGDDSSRLTLHYVPDDRIEPDEEYLIKIAPSIYYVDYRYYPYTRNLYKHITGYFSRRYKHIPDIFCWNCKLN
jgi:hypothetical protein